MERKIALVSIGFTAFMFAGLFVHFNSRINTAYAAKPDTCQIYAKEAEKYLKDAEAVKNNGKYGSESRPASPYYWHSQAAVSAMYSSYYLVCRDLERRNH